MPLYADMIAETEKEIASRERLAIHVSGASADANNVELGKLYDVLIYLHIKELETAACYFCGQRLPARDVYCCPHCGWKVGARNAVR